MNKQNCQFGNCGRSGKIMVTKDGEEWLFVCTIHAQGYEVWKNKENYFE